MHCSDSSMEEGTSVIYEQNMNGSLMQITPVSSGNQAYSTWGMFYGNFYTEASTLVPVTNENSYSAISKPCKDENETDLQAGPGESKSAKRCRRRKSKLDVLPENAKPPKKQCSNSKKDICKMARNSGKPYVKLKGKDKGTFVGEKEVGPDCLCPNKCFEKVGGDTIQKIFRDFWALGDYNSQNAYLFGLINLLGVKRRYTKNQISRRNFTIMYSVKKRGENVNVCKKAFLNIHGLQRNRGRINNLANKMKEGESVPPPDRRGRHTNRPNAYSEEAVLHVKNHLAQCPKVEKKKNSSKSSKQMEYSTKRCYDLYVAVYCKQHDLLPVSLDKYRRIYWEEGYRNSQGSSKRVQGNVMPSNVTIRKLSS